MSQYIDLNTNQYELILSKQSHTLYIIGLATTFIFLLINLVVIIMWIKNKNKTFLSICRLLIKQKQHKNYNDQATSIFNPSKKYLKRQISIENKTNQQHFSSQSKIQVKQNSSNKSQLYTLDPILYEQVNKICQSVDDKIQIKKISNIHKLKVARQWVDCLSIYQPFFIVIFMLIAVGNSGSSPKTQVQYAAQHNGTLIIIGLILMIISLFLYFFINCSGLFFKFLNLFDSSKTKVSPLSEQNPTCINLNKIEEETKKNIGLKSSKFLTCNGIQTQISIHQNAIDKLNQPQCTQRNNGHNLQRKSKIKILSKKIQDSSHLLEIAYLLPIVVSLLVLAINTL